MVAGSELIYIYQTRSGCDVKMYPTTGLRPVGGRGKAGFLPPDMQAS